jgi:L-rhamnose mutarotase
MTDFLSPYQHGQAPLIEQVTKRIGSLIRVRPEFEERYIILHKHTFPGVLAQIHRAHIRNYSIFFKAGILFSYYEYVGNDFTQDMAGIGEDQTTREWWKLTDPMQEPLETRKEGEWWATMEELFFVETLQKLSGPIVRNGYVRNVDGEIFPGCLNHLCDIPSDLLEIMGRCHVIKIAAYYKDGRVYHYYETSGTDAQNGLSLFLKDPQVLEFLNQPRFSASKFPTISEAEWQVEMDEVFHTD